MQRDERTDRTPKRGRRSPRGKRAVMHGCVRTCAACRAAAPREDLLRFALDGGRITFDLDRRLPGRGVNLGPSPLCLDRAQKRGVFHRAFKVGLSPEDARVLAADVRERVRARCQHWIADGFRRGALVTASHDPASIVGRLWREDALSDLVSGIPPVGATTPRATAKMAAIVRVASEFTLGRAGDMKRRPEPADICPALDSAVRFAKVEAVVLPTAGGPTGLTSNDEAGVSLTRRPSGGSE